MNRISLAPQSEVPGDLEAVDAEVAIAVGLSPVKWVSGPVGQASRSVSAAPPRRVCTVVGEGFAALLPIARKRGQSVTGSGNSSVCQCVRQRPSVNRMGRDGAMTLRRAVMVEASSFHVRRAGSLADHGQWMRKCVD